MAQDSITPASTSEHVTVVTGGGSGIGRAVVLRLLTRGHAILIADLNPDSAAATIKLANELSASPRVRFVRADVSDEDDVADAISEAQETFGPLTGFVASAGVGGAFGSVTEIEVDDWDYTFDVLMRGVFVGTKHAARAFLARGRGGSIVNVASVGALSGFGPHAYSSAKAGVVNFTRSAAVELAAQRIRVNAVAPGAILTPFTDGRDPEAAAERMTGAQPWPEHGRPENVAAAIDFLLSDDAGFITGELLAVDGGLTAAGPGLDYAARFGGDPRGRGLVGVNRGTTGQTSEIRRRVDQ
jgi:NAD(P)-dependent dehydrogenase (short-subunit alcohol dehydrogenase family)